MKIDSVIWNNLVKMPEKDYNEEFGYLFDKTEYLSDKLKKYRLNIAQRDLKNELTSYHFFIAKARESFNSSITVYKINKDIIEKIINTKIEKMPNEIPSMFKRPFIIEAHDLNSNLFGDINSIVGFFHELDNISAEKLNTKYLLTILLHARPIEDKNWYQTSIKLNSLARKAKVDFSYLGSNLFCLIPPIKNNTWNFDKTDYNRKILMNINYCNQCDFRNGCEGAAKPDLYCNYLFCYDGLCDNLLSFITIFNYMLEAENSPIEINRKTEHTISTTMKKNKIIEKKQEWIIKYLYLDKSKIKYEKPLEHSELDKEGLIQKNIRVKGHLRYQAYGSGFKDHKWIYIESFITTKWVKDGDTKIIVGLNKES